MSQLLRRLALPVAVALTIVGCARGEPGQEADGPAWTVPQSTAPAPATTLPRAAGPTTLRQLPPPPDILPADERLAAPGLSVAAFDGRTVTLGGFRGQPAVVNFFESW
jgi:hypothetical protein